MDQATCLRSAVLASQRSTAGPVVSARTIAFLAGKGGVGTTTVAVNVAAALRARGLSLGLLDADTCRQDALLLSGGAGGNWAQLPDLDASPPPHAGGVPVISGCGRWRESQTSHVERYPQAVQSLLAAGLDYRTLLIDVGRQSDAWQLAWCRQVDQVVIATTPDAVAIVDTYALLKRLSRLDRPIALGLVLTHAHDPHAVAETAIRLVRSARRFLQLEVRMHGAIPLEPRFRDSAVSGRPLVSAAPKLPASKSLDRLATDILEGTERTMPGVEINSSRLAPHTDDE